VQHFFLIIIIIIIIIISTRKITDTLANQTV